MGIFGLLLAAILFITSTADGQVVAAQILGAYDRLLSADAVQESERFTQQNDGDESARQNSEPGKIDQKNPTPASPSPETPEPNTRPQQSSPPPQSPSVSPWRTECEKHNQFVDVKVQDLITSIAKLEQSIPVLRARADEANAAYDADWNWSDFTRHMELATAKDNAQSALTSAEFQLTAAYQELNFAALNYRDCSY